MHYYKYIYIYIYIFVLYTQFFFLTTNLFSVITPKCRTLQFIYVPCPFYMGSQNDLQSVVSGQGENVWRKD